MVDGLGLGRYTEWRPIENAVRRASSREVWPVSSSLELALMKAVWPELPLERALDWGYEVTPPQRLKSEMKKIEAEESEKEEEEC